jgi:acetylornithine deacetylase
MTPTGSIFATLERLIGFDTTSRESNIALIQWIEAYLSERGILSHRVPSDDLRKANLIARIGPGRPGGIVLSGHTDVVPVDGQPWSTPPFELTDRGDRFAGRGTADMKSFIALCLAHVDAMLAADLKRPIIFAFSYDEEVGCLGAPRLIAEIARLGFAPHAVIVGEPTDMQVVSGHKGIRTFIVEVTGREAHSSQTGQGVSAIMAASELVGLIAAMNREADEKADPASLFEPKGPTMTVGMIEGGTAVNILARRCQFVWDLRSPTHAMADHYEQRFFAAAAELDARIKEKAPEGGVTITRRSSSPPLTPALDSPAERLARALTGDNSVRAAAYAAEAGLFQQAAMPAVLCGPGSILQAHQPDEFILKSQLEAGAAFQRALIAHLTQD